MVESLPKQGCPKGCQTFGVVTSTAGCVDVSASRVERWIDGRSRKFEETNVCRCRGDQKVAKPLMSLRQPLVVWISQLVER